MWDMIRADVDKAERRLDGNDASFVYKIRTDYWRVTSPNLTTAQNTYLERLIRQHIGWPLSMPEVASEHRKLFETVEKQDLAIAAIDERVRYLQRSFDDYRRANQGSSREHHSSVLREHRIEIDTIMRTLDAISNRLNRVEATVNP